MANDPTMRDVSVQGLGTSGPAGPRVVQVQKSLMVHNDGVAAKNREAFAGSLVLNVVSSPGSGKTALLERTVRELAGELKVGIVVGDLETANDAERLFAAGAPGTVCLAARAGRRWGLVQSLDAHRPGVDRCRDGPERRRPVLRRALWFPA